MSTLIKKPTNAKRYQLVKTDNTSAHRIKDVKMCHCALMDGISANRIKIVQGLQPAQMATTSTKSKRNVSPNPHAQMMNI